MDTDHVSKSAFHLHLLHKQRAVLKAAKARQGEKPRASKGRAQLVDEFMKQRAYTNMPLNFQAKFHTTFVPLPYLPSCVPLADLQPILIKDLRLETHHAGTSLLVRAITPANYMTAVMAMVEDEAGDAVLIQLFHQGSRQEEPAAGILKDKDVMVIKEPYFKIMADGEYGLRVDHVSDLVRVIPADRQLPAHWTLRNADSDKTANDWKLQGNAAMKAGQHPTAMACYTKALNCPTSLLEQQIIRLNRALAYLKTECFDCALADTDCLDDPSIAPEKALFRAGQALYGLRRFSDCHRIFEALCQKYPRNAEAMVELKRVESRLAEQANGIYNYDAIREQLTTLRPPHLDLATFHGPVVVKVSTGRGRGLFTTRAVKAGELVLCEKAFAYCYANSLEFDKTLSPNVSTLINLDTGQCTVGTQGDLITTIVQMLWRNPSLMPDFIALHHGTYKPVHATEVDGKPIVDTFLVEKIIALNAFGCCLSTLANQTARVERPEPSHSSGVWLKASYINHSCLCNVRRSFLGDLILVRATQDVPADTELTFWYQEPQPGQDYAERQKGLASWGFTCDCAWCLELKATPKKLLSKRNALLTSLSDSMGQSPHLRKAERLLAAIERTYHSPSSKVPRLDVFHQYVELTRFLDATKRPVQLVATAIKALESLGFVLRGADVLAASLPCQSSAAPFQVVQWGFMTQSVVVLWCRLWVAYAIVFAPQSSLMAQQMAQTSYGICSGEDASFEASFGKNVRNSMSGLGYLGSMRNT